MRNRCLGLVGSVAVLSASCGGGDDSGAGATLVSGSLAIETVADPVPVAMRSAWAFDDGSRAVVYVAPPEDASCEDVARYLAGVERDVDPSPIWEADNCAITLVADFDGSDATWSNDLVHALVSITCQTGDGTFVWEERGKGGFAWYFSGRTWQAVASEWTVSLSRGADDGILVDLEMSAFDGDFVYEFVEAAAKGTISGHASARRCAGLSEAMIF
jgi:hypothetical protein